MNTVYKVEKKKAYLGIYTVSVLCIDLHALISMLFYVFQCS